MYDFFRGSNNTVKGYISFGKAKVLITVILPINVNFLCCHRFKQLVNSFSFGYRFCSCIFLVSAKKIIPKVLADSDDHKKFKCFRYSTAVFHRTVVFLLFSFNPETDLKVSKTLKSSRNEFKVPSNAKVASSANIVHLNSFPIN